MPDLVIDEARDRIEATWRHLEALARPHYVQSWGWIENWLSSLSYEPPLFVIVDDAGEPIAAAFEDQPLLRTPAFPPLGLVGDGFRIDRECETAHPHVDLDTVRAVAGGYASTLPSVIRAHLFHARRQQGELEVEAVTDTPRAHQIFDELLALQGVTDDPFHRRLIDQRATHGEIQLLRIRAHGATIGCLFNVTWFDQVVHQRAGFASSSDADLCHAAAIEHNAARGFAFYELPPEDARLATGETRRVVLRFQRAERAKLAG